uniref:Uncharacterized protein n=1 Tax=Siphoviridae sp. ctzyE57 TaxID=2827982 RepID=A0A8S5SGN1_9CAUD|nr:MAG TPA: hypothetical protein [Siphoviridae sp. ctzyE57]
MRDCQNGRRDSPRPRDDKPWGYVIKVCYSLPCARVYTRRSTSWMCVRAN